MSPKRHSNIVATRGRSPVFATLGDETRLSLIAKLCAVQHGSITQLTEGSNLSRQAITKHLRVLERVGIVRCVRKGRESRFQFNPEPIEGIREYLDFVSQQWDQAPSRGKSFVEDERPRSLNCKAANTQSQSARVTSERRP